MRVALVHDYLTQYGGAERVLEVLCEMFPNAPIFTLLYDEEGTRGVFADRRIVTSFLQRIPFVRTHHRLFPPLMPLAIEQFDLSAYPLVISDSASFAKGIITRPETMHICYCHTPTRFAWDDSHRYLEEFGGYPWPLRRLAPFFVNWLRLWDHAAATRPDVFLANSHHVRRRIKKYYGQNASVLFPPVRVDFFAQGKREPSDFFLMAGRLIPYKRFDLGIGAAKAAGFSLHIVGEGPQQSRLMKLAAGAPQIKFLGPLSDEALREEYLHCRALLFPQEEDFGLVAVEAMAAGAPVIAWRGGGALEVVEEGKTGIFFDAQEVDDILEAIRRFEAMRISPDYIRDYARRFDASVFCETLQKFIAQQLQVRN